MPKERKKSYILESLPSLEEIKISERIPFGITQLDFLTKGGVPVNAISLLTGPEGSAKTTAAIMALRGFQQMYPEKKAIYINAENRVPPSWAQKLGVDNNRVSVFYPSFGEEAHGLMKTCVNEWHDVGLIIVDSLEALSPSSEVESDPTKDEFMAIAARRNNTFFRQITMSQCNMAKEGKGCTIIIINQERTNIARYGDPVVLPGGKGQRFFASLWLKFKGRDVETHEFYDKEHPGHLSIPQAANVRFVVVKNLDAPSGFSGEFSLSMVSDGVRSPGVVESFDFLFIWASRLGIITNAGPKGSMYKGEYRRREEWIQEWRRNPSSYREIQRETFDAFWGAIENGNLRDS